MSKKETGGAAFPFMAVQETDYKYSDNGMTLRDYFAG